MFSSQASGLGETFTPRIIGFGAVASNISAVLDARPQALVVTGAAAAYLLLWTFLAGGILDRYARNRPIRTAAFFSACGVYFVRFLRLAVFAGLGYWILFGPVHRLAVRRLLPLGDPRVDRRAQRLLPAPGALRRLRRRAGRPSTCGSTTRRSGPSSRTAGA